MAEKKRKEKKQQNEITKWKDQIRTYLTLKNSLFCDFLRWRSVPQLLQTNASSQKIPITRWLRNIEPPTHLIFYDMSKKRSNLNRHSGQKYFKGPAFRFFEEIFLSFKRRSFYFWEVFLGKYCFLDIGFGITIPSCNIVKFLKVMHHALKMFRDISKQRENAKTKMRDKMFLNSGKRSKQNVNR